MHAFKRLYARNAQTACHVTLLQEEISQLEPTGFEIYHKTSDGYELVSALCWVSY